MTKGEVAKLLAVLAASFPRFEVNDLKIRVWHEMLGDIDYAVASMAVKKLIMQNTFAPAIAEVRRAAMEIMCPEQVTGSEAWGEVTRAIRNYGYYREAEALASMSPTTARVVRHMGWQDICTSIEPTGVLRGQFLKMYGQVADREQEQQLLPAGLREQIGKLAAERDLRLIQGKVASRGGSTNDFEPPAPALDGKGGTISKRKLPHQNGKRNCSHFGQEHMCNTP